MLKKQDLGAPAIISSLQVLCHRSQSEIPLRRFEYKYSFKPPYLAQKDGSVPFWEYGGKLEFVYWYTVLLATPITASNLSMMFHVFERPNDACTILPRKFAIS
ncbi:unnamed protein product [Timema podura]|uniref:Uncharacterized protein n=1 Tax=Timema podura TaxID=61482 RepID=A0ABN7NRI2_TIMPD|nr:unnamed protein product [Timema podura]